MVQVLNVAPRGNTFAINSFQNQIYSREELFRGCETRLMRQDKPGPICTRRVHTSVWLKT